MNCFENAMEHVLRWEGGLINDPDDAGGLTNRGVTLKFLTTFCKLAGFSPTDNLRSILIHMNREKTLEIYKNTFWKWLEGDEIKNCSVALAIFDFFVNADQLKIRKNLNQSGVIRNVQDILNVPIDGLMGPITIKALNEFDQERFFNALQLRRKNYYNAIVYANPRNKKFLKGWLKRMDSLKFIP